MKEFLIIALLALSIFIWSSAIEVFNEREETDFTPFINAELFMILFSILSWNIWFAITIPIIVLLFVACWYIFKYTILLGEKISEIMKKILGTKLSYLDTKLKQLKGGENE